MPEAFGLMECTADRIDCRCEIEMQGLFSEGKRMEGQGLFGWGEGFGREAGFSAARLTIRL
jgi:hypothetical protein